MSDDISLRDGDIVKANLCLAGVIVVFVLLTLVAYLLSDGRPHCIIPLLRKCCPTCKWVVQQDNVETDDEKLLVFQVGLAQHVMGARRPCRQV